MKKVFSIKDLKISYSTLLLLLMSLFFITKMFRAFSGSSTQGGIWVLIQLFLMFVGFVLILKKIKSVYKNPAIVALILYVAFAMLNSLFTIEFTILPIYSYTMIPYALCVLMIFFVDGTYRNIENNVILSVTFYLISAIFVFFMLRSGSYSTQTGSVSDAYYVLGLLPLVLVCSKKWSIIPILCAGIVIIISGKRAGLIAFVLMVVSFFLVEVLVSKQYKSLAVSFVSLVIIAAIGYIAFMAINQNFNVRLLTRFLRISEDGGSGRSERWNAIVTAVNDSSLFNIVFGHGVEAVTRDFGGYSHNDFLELLYNYGIVAVGFYISFYVVLIFDFFKMLKHKYKYTAQFFMSIVFSLMVALTSFYVIIPAYITAGMICTGYFLSDFQKQQQNTIQG